MIRPTSLLPAICLCLVAQGPLPERSGSRLDSPEILRTPDGRNRTELILKADHEASLKDIDAMKKLVEEVKIDMEKNDRHVLSVATLKKLEDIEKLSKKVRGRMKRF
ncbi:MAG TPA: hypothetical protein VFQ91_22240 [Bryobacteraceae bacterium]|nr:hypothetical protein [Bryobacteraceae bacterium]